MNVNTEDIIHLNEQWIHNERDRAIVYRRLIDGIKYETLAEEFKLSVKQTQRIVYRCQDKIFKHWQKSQK